MTAKDAFFNRLRRGNKRAGAKSINNTLVEFYDTRDDKFFPFDHYRVTQQIEYDNSESFVLETVAAAGHLILMTRDEITPGNLKEFLNHELVTAIKPILNGEESSDTFIITLSDPYDEHALEKLKKHVEENNIHLIKQIDFDNTRFLQTNDDLFGEQWSLYDNWASSVRVEDVWKYYTKGSSEIIVGVLDTGIDKDHEDLRGNIYDHELDSLGRPRILNFINQDTNNRDDNGHGTQVSGIIGAKGHNDKGITGIAWDVKLYPAKVGTSSGGVSDSHVISALKYLKRIRGLHFINASFGDYAYSDCLKSAIEDLANFNDGILLIAGAGNDGRNIDKTPFYPASFDLGNIISVAATNKRERLLKQKILWRNYKSNYGQKSVDIAAPGAEIKTTYRSNKYDDASGTSIAAPHVTGLCVLLKAASGNLTGPEIKQIILDNAKKNVKLRNKVAGCRQLKMLPCFEAL